MRSNTASCRAQAPVFDRSAVHAAGPNLRRYAVGALTTGGKANAHHHRQCIHVKKKGLVVAQSPPVRARRTFQQTEYHRTLSQLGGQWRKLTDEILPELIERYKIGKAALLEKRLYPY